MKRRNAIVPEAHARSNLQHKYKYLMEAQHQKDFKTPSAPFAALLDTMDLSNLCWLWKVPPHCETIPHARRKGGAPGGPQPTGGGVYRAAPSSAAQNTRGDGAAGSYSVVTWCEAGSPGACACAHATAAALNTCYEYLLDLERHGVLRGDNVRG